MLTGRVNLPRRLLVRRLAVLVLNLESGQETIARGPPGLRLLAVLVNTQSGPETLASRVNLPLRLFVQRPAGLSTARLVTVSRETAKSSTILLSIPTARRRAIAHINWLHIEMFCIYYLHKYYFTYHLTRRRRMAPARSLPDPP